MQQNHCNHNKIYPVTNCETAQLKERAGGRVPLKFFDHSSFPRRMSEAKSLWKSQMEKVSAEKTRKTRELMIRNLIFDLWVFALTQLSSTLASWLAVEGH